MVTNAVIAVLIAGGLYLFAGVSPEKSIITGALVFLGFSFNLARAEIEELKLILDQEAPGWRERNASWTSTWDWNRVLKRKLRRDRKHGKSLAESTDEMLGQRNNETANRD